MTYRDLYEQLIEKYADEKGIIRGKLCSLIYRISRAGEEAGFDSVVDEAWYNDLPRGDALNDR